MERKEYYVQPRIAEKIVELSQEHALPVNIIVWESVGNLTHITFGKHSCNHSILILSDMPQTQKGSWFLHYKDKMDVEVIRGIEGLIYDIWKMKERMKSIKASGKDVPKALVYQLRHKDKQLNQLRSVATYYKEYSSIENLQLLGENYIRQMKRDLKPLTFQTSILCQRIGIAKDGFYSSMREKHKYDASNFEYLDQVAQSFYADEQCSMVNVQWIAEPTGILIRWPRSASAWTITRTSTGLSQVNRLEDD